LAISQIEVGAETTDSCLQSAVGKVRRQHGITDKQKVFHSFRHTVKDAFREAEVPKDLFDALQGHAAGDVSAGYGQGYSLRRLADAMEKLAYP